MYTHSLGHLERLVSSLTAIRFGCLMAAAHLSRSRRLCLSFVQYSSLETLAFLSIQFLCIQRINLSTPKRAHTRPPASCSTPLSSVLHSPPKALRCRFLAACMPTHNSQRSAMTLWFATLHVWLRCGDLQSTVLRAAVSVVELELLYNCSIL